MKQLTPRKFDRDRFLVDVEIRSLRGGVRFQAHALDLGESGMGVFAQRYLEVGQPVELVLPTGGGIVGSIANARVESDGNILGIAFARPLEAAEMQSLKKALGVGTPR